jgi:hypothetical protein
VNEEIMAQFAQIQRYAAGLRGLLAEAQAMAPGQSHGSDRSGALRVTIGPDGLPNAFRIAPDWKRRIEAESFGSAVLEACQAAIGERLSAWTTALADDGWQDKVERLKGGPAEPAPPGQPPPPIPPAFTAAAERARPRPPEQLAEDVLGALADVEQSIPAPASGSGSAARGKLAVTISDTGLTSCTADPEWVAEQTAAMLTNEMTTALDQARADLRARSQRPRSATGTDRLIAETLALLNDPSRLADL